MSYLLIWIPIVLVVIALFFGTLRRPAIQRKEISK